MTPQMSLYPLDTLPWCCLVRAPRHLASSLHHHVWLGCRVSYGLHPWQGFVSVCLPSFVPSKEAGFVNSLQLSHAHRACPIAWSLFPWCSTLLCCSKGCFHFHQRSLLFLLLLLPIAHAIPHVWSAVMLQDLSGFPHLPFAFMAFIVHTILGK